MKRKVLFEAVGLVILMGLLVFITQILLKSIPITTTSKSPISSPLAHKDTDSFGPTPLRATPESVAVAIDPTPTASVPLKPTLTPSATPTVTPIPTSLPLPEGDFNVLWADSLSDAMGSTIWLANPSDIGQRQELLALDRQAVYSLAGSPDGKYIAFTSAGWRVSVSPLQVMNADGSNLRELATNAGQIFWTADSQEIVYATRGATDVWVIERVSVVSGTVTQWVTITAESEYMGLLGWADNGTNMFYVVRDPQAQGYATELHKAVVGSHVASKVTVFEEFYTSALSSSGRYLKHASTPEGVIVYDLHNQTTQFVPLLGRGQVIWGATAPELFTLDLAGEFLPIRSYSLTDAEDNKQVFRFYDVPSGVWGLEATSPDDKWFVAHHSQGYYWLHRESGWVVPVPNEARCIFSWLHK